ncbi:transmembrane protein, putative (macronuclear) [Tetrahymena thermophila SB210]|uniref:Transmembrane protein, putative n=1 Tax=Tetrahymena thermophila (strain SB210) TaxID=312017 RepID=W7XEG3_TETTS|nr:transmembrane protein, putative [Tetrahymena thermophila SB210]EWS76077.1 transmembrane protein, putative [Tetrahymena thermophila SB210]|eukprot:XP_012651384.1 transmembrane protein, putative [Tetrahymena thermophila SB210]
MKIYNKIDHYSSQFDIIIHANEILRFSEKDFNNQMNQKDRLSVNMNKKCLWIEQKKMDYEKGDEKSYFYLKNNENLILSLNDYALLQVDEVLSKYKSNYFVIKVDNFSEYKILLLFNSNSLISDNQIVIRFRFFSQGQYFQYMVHGQEEIKQINIGNAQYVEVDTFKDITQTSIIFLQNQLSNAVRYPKLIDLHSTDLIFIQKMKDNNTIIHLYDRKSYYLQQKQQFNYQYLLVSCENIQLNIIQVKYYESNQDAGYILQYLNSTQTTLQIDYIHILQNQNTTPEFGKDYEINQANRDEFNIKIFNQVLENDVLNILKQQFYSQILKLEVLIVISNNYYLFQREIKYQRVFPNVNFNYKSIFIFINLFIQKNLVQQVLLINGLIKKLDFLKDDNTVSYEIESSNQNLIFESYKYMRLYIKQNKSEFILAISKIIAIPKNYFIKRQINAQIKEQQNKIIIFSIIILLLLIIVTLLAILIKKLRNIQI